MIMCTNNVHKRHMHLIIILYTFLYFCTGLEINFQKPVYSILEGSPLSVTVQFRPTQSPFTFTVKPVSIASAETSGLGDFIYFDNIREDSGATAG